jgi:hypothetical protein
MHTPGKWVITSRYGNLKTEIAAGSKAIATVWTHQPVSVANDKGRGYHDLQDPEGIANARLISAAPDLLAALKAILAHPRTGDRCVVFMPDEVAQAQAAIAKSKGA